MNKSTARKLLDYHKFTKLELYNILKDALEDLPKEYWDKPSKINPIFDNGKHFNLCVEWLDYREGVNDECIPRSIVTFRILEGFGKYSKVQLPKKKKVKVEIKCSAKPSLKN